MNSDRSATATFDWRPVERHFGQLRAERDELLELLERSYEEFDLWRTELHGREQALDAKREELENQREELARQHAAPRETREAEADDPQAAALREQCELLETELETVRERTAELCDALARNEREMAQRQAQWELEREQLRRLVEPREPSPASAAPVPAAAPADDAVVGSVAAQFARLSRERADRRAREKKAR